MNESDEIVKGIAAGFGAALVIVSMISIVALAVLIAIHGASA